VIVDSTSKWRGAKVWDCERCRVVLDVLWIDSESLEYCTLNRPIRITSAGEATSTIHRARKIEWLWPSKLILINPIDDTGPEDGDTNIVMKEQLPSAINDSPSLT
jgi:hypothetical protein